MQYWKIVALIGAVIFLLSGFLPLVSVFNIVSISLVDVYRLIGAASTEISETSVPITASAIGLLLAIFLYIPAAIVGFVGVFKRKAALAAGILGLICWIGAVIGLAMPIPDASFSLLQYVGAGVFVGFVAAIILIAAYFLKPRQPAQQVAPVAQPSQGTYPPPPPPPTPQAQSPVCPTCGGPLTYISQYQRWYCYKDNKYV